MEPSRAKDGRVAERFNLNFERDRLFWVLEKLELAARHLEADKAPILWRLEHALLEMHAVWPRDLPKDLHEQFDPIRAALRAGVSLVMTDWEAEAVGQAILKLRAEVGHRIDQQRRAQ
jgi:hypothetical protein